MATSTPWGPSQAKTCFTRGINSYTTASHGGFILSKGKNAFIPEYARNESGAYEEDCDYAIVITFFPGFFPEAAQEQAKKSLMTWNPEIYERFYGETLLPGQSHVKDKKAFEQDALENNRFVVVAAWGDWHEKVPSGFVGVVAAAGRTGSREYFLVPEDEYEARQAYGFVVDLDRHKDWVNHA